MHILIRLLKFNVFTLEQKKEDKACILFAYMRLDGLNSFTEEREQQQQFGNNKKTTTNNETYF